MNKVRRSAPRRALLLTAAGLVVWALPLRARAELPALLRTENKHVAEGNEKLTKGDAKGALESYAVAARELPEAPGLQLDRGLALLKAGELGKARESFVSATTPTAPPSLRADAYQNLALALYREGDKLAGEKKHKEAQQMFQESIDAGKRSLRLRPGDANTAWNLELAARRIRDEEQKQKEEDEKKQQEDQDKDEDKQPDDKPKDDSQNQEQKPNDKQDQDKPDQDKQDQDKQDQDKQDDAQDPKPPQPEQAKPDPQKPPDQPQEGPEAGKDQPDQAKEAQLPVEAEQALDALSDSEENFERYRARQRASRERRAPEKDW